jgi:hypothetical protein
MKKNKTTYADISEYVRQRSGFVPKGCWIAHVKELRGFEVPWAWNRVGKRRQVPCPPDKRPAIERALRHFRYAPPDSN